MDTSLRSVWGARHPEIDRLFIALWYVPIGAGIHAAVALTGDPTAYQYFAENAYLPIYRFIFQDLVPQNVVLFAAIITLFEVVLGLLLFGKGAVVRYALLASAVFQILLAPTTTWGFLNVLLAVMSVMLLRYDYDETLYEVFVRHFFRQSE
jgi:hypothetical protein